MNKHRFGFSLSLCLHIAFIFELVYLQYPITFHFGGFKQTAEEMQQLYNTIKRDSMVKRGPLHIEFQLAKSSSNKKPGESKLKEGENTNNKKSEPNQKNIQKSGSDLPVQKNKTGEVRAGGLENKLFAGWAPPPENKSSSNQVGAPKTIAESTADGYNLYSIPKHVCSKSFGGIGLSFNTFYNFTDPGSRIINVAPGYAADKAGIQAGDFLISPATDKLVGKVGTSFYITYRHLNITKKIKIVREEICYRENLAIQLPKK
jgi:hypothetical protein